MGVLIIPAETAFTRTPFLACSMARAYVAAFNAPLARDVRTVMMDRVVTGSLPSIDVKNFSSDETRRVEIQSQE